MQTTTSRGCDTKTPPQSRRRATASTSIIEINTLPEIAAPADDAALEAQRGLLQSQETAAARRSETNTTEAAVKLTEAVNTLTSAGGVNRQDPASSAARLKALGTMKHARTVMAQHTEKEAGVRAERDGIADQKRMNARAGVDGAGVEKRRRFVAPTLALLSKHRFSTTFKLTAKQFEEQCIWFAKAFAGDETFSAPFRKFQQMGEPYQCTFKGKCDRLDGLCYLVEDTTATPENGRIPVIYSCETYAKTGGFCAESLAIAVMYFNFKVHEKLTFLHRPAKRDQKPGSECLTKPTVGGKGTGLSNARTLKKIEIMFPKSERWTSKPFDPKKLVAPQSPAVGIDDTVAVRFTDEKDEPCWRSGTVLKPSTRSKKDKMVRVKFPDEQLARQCPAEFFYHMNVDHNYRVVHRV